MPFASGMVRPQLSSAPIKLAMVAYLIIVSLIGPAKAD
ncbi:hypothetical protein PJE062_2897 [Pseudovibrio sp. JE062]|nr:hypothetical protein PJE062_2897 [Pseudovibrio sp. JE062]